MADAAVESFRSSTIERSFTGAYDRCVNARSSACGRGAARSYLSLVSALLFLALTAGAAAFADNAS
jgi:hypothetical protein